MSRPSAAIGQQALVPSSGMGRRHEGENGLRLWVEGEAGAEAAGEAFRRFHVLLGVVRAWKPIADELVVEREASLGSGPARDESGNQTIHVGPARMYVRFPGDLERFASRVREAKARHPRLRDALRLYGKSNRDAADYFNIGELCAADLGRSSIAVVHVAQQLGIALGELKLFEWSTNNLGARDGGRHALQTRIDQPPAPGAVAWNLDEIRDFVAEVIRAWIGM